MTAASEGSQPIETDEDELVHGFMWTDDAEFSVFLLLHQFEVGCWRTAPRY